MTTESPVPKRNKKYIYFIGLDISKNELDFAVFKEKIFLFHTEIKNEEADILALVDRLQQLPAFKLSKAVFCMENTGFYGNHFLNTLMKLKASIVQEHPLRIKKSMGSSRGKDDKADAIRIAEYAWKNRTELKLWIPKRAIVTEISELMTIRNRLLGISVTLRNPQKEKKTFTNTINHYKHASFSKDSIEVITTGLLRIEQEIKLLLDSDKYLSRLMQIITSVPFIGFITAVNIIICTNEYRDITNPKKFACYAGVAPFPNESGLMVRKRRVSYMANKKMKALLHLCAVGAGTRDPELKIYFKRKLLEGKHKISIFNAIRYKIILRVFACLKQDRLFVKHDQRDKILLSHDEYQQDGRKGTERVGE